MGSTTYPFLLYICSVMRMDEFKTEAEYEQAVLWERERKKEIDREILASKERLQNLRERFKSCSNS